MADTHAGDLRYIRDPETLWRGTIGGVLVLPPGEKESWHITSPGDIIWDLLATPHTPGELVEALSTAFDAPTDTITADIQPVLKKLYDIGATRRLTSS